jgi:hypothetical protein
MKLLPLLLLYGCGTLGLGFNVGRAKPETGDPNDTGDGPATVDASIMGRTWSADLAQATIPEPEGLGGFLALMDSTAVLFHVSKDEGNDVDLVFALTGADGHQDLCQPVLDFSGADFSGNPWLTVSKTSVPLRINGVEVELRDAQLELLVHEFGQGFQRGWMVAEVDGRELDEALGDRIPSSTCEILDALGTTCHDCGDGSSSCFYIRIEELEGVDYGGPFDPEPDPSECG